MRKDEPRARNQSSEALPTTILSARITTIELAELLGLSPQRVRQLKSEKVLVSVERNRWNLSDSVRSYLTYRERLDQERTASAVVTRVQDARADEIQLRVLERSRALVKHAQDEAMTIIDRIIGSLKADLYAMPARITADLNIRHRLEMDIDNILTAAAKRAQEQCDKSAEEGGEQ